MEKHWNHYITKNILQRQQFVENLAQLSEPIRIPSAKLLTNFWSNRRISIRSKEALFSYDDISVHILKKEKTRRLSFYILESKETEGRKCGTNLKGDRLVSLAKE